VQALPTRLLGSLLLLVLFLPVAASASDSALVGIVSWIYDGDTIKVEPQGKVRLLGIDAPESESGPRDDFYLRRGLKQSQLREAARQAKTWLRQNLKGRQVRLVLDRTKRDKYDRLLAYVYLDDGRLINRVLLEKGLATVFRRFDFSLKEEFLAAEAAAKAQRVGLWQSLD